MNRLKILLLVPLVVFAAAFFATAPHGIEAVRLLAAQDNPAALADLALSGTFTREAAEREIASALAAGDAELAQSFVDLAQERGIAVDPALATKVEEESRAARSFAATASTFARGFVTGEPDDVASLAGTMVGDLCVFGDVRDAVREGTRLVRGEDANRLLLGLSLGGLGVTAGAYASIGLAAPARAGLSLVKAAGRTERVGARLARLVRWEKPAALAELAGDVGGVQARAGSRAALDGLRLAEQPKDMTRLAQLAAVKGGKTRALLKFLGRGAIVLAKSTFDLALLVFWGLVNIIGFCASLKRWVERMTLAIIRCNKLRRARARAASAVAV